MPITKERILGNINGPALDFTKKVASKQLAAWQESQRKEGVAGLTNYMDPDSEAPKKDFEMAVVPRTKIPELFLGNLEKTDANRVEIANLVVNSVATQLENLGIKNAKDLILQGSHPVADRLAAFENTNPDMTNAQGFIALFGPKPTESAEFIIKQPGSDGKVYPKAVVMTPASLVERFTTVNDLNKSIPALAGASDEAREKFFGEVASLLTAELESKASEMVVHTKKAVGRDLTTQEESRVKMATIVFIAERYNSTPDPRYQATLTKTVKDGPSLAKAFASRVSEKTLGNPRFQSLVTTAAYPNADRREINQWLKDNPLSSFSTKTTSEVTPIVKAINALNLKPEAKLEAMTLAAVIGQDVKVSGPELRREAACLEKFPKVAELLNSPEGKAQLLTSIGYNASRAAVQEHGRLGYLQAAQEAELLTPEQYDEFVREAKRTIDQEVADVTTLRAEQKAKNPEYKAPLIDKTLHPATLSFANTQVLAGKVSEFRWEYAKNKAIEESREVSGNEIDRLMGR
jgi:hypothetical protein